MGEFCGSCGTLIDGTHPYCARCGVFLGWKHWAPPLEAQICARCEAPNAPGRSDCGSCFASLGPAPGDNAYCGQVYAFEHLPPPGPGREIGPPRTDGACRSCGTMNPSGEAFCGSCGFFLESDPPVMARDSDTTGPRGE